MKKQPKPKKNKHPHVVDILIKDLKARKKKGLKAYGVALQPFNGRDALQDFLEEYLDGLCYLRQYIMEQNAQKRYKRR